MEDQTTGEIGAALKAGRLAAKLSLLEAAYELRNHAPKGFWRTGEAIRAYEKGVFDPDDMSVVIVLQSLAKVYGIEIPALAEKHKSEWRRLAEILSIVGLATLYITDMNGVDSTPITTPASNVRDAEDEPDILFLSAA